jgi:AbiV family abortive infection protein
VASCVTEQTLLQGAWYALEQAGQLFDSAVTLFDAEQFGIASGVAMLGREELGRYKILRSLANDVSKGHVISVEYVRAECEDHEQKQRAATLSTTMRTQRGTRLDDALPTQMHETPGSHAWRDADEVLALATASKIKRTPADRHQLRFKSFYGTSNRTVLPRTALGRALLRRLSLPRESPKSGQ